MLWVGGWEEMKRRRVGGWVGDLTEEHEEGHKDRGDHNSDLATGGDSTTHHCLYREKEGGWVGGWVGMIEETQAVRMRCCMGGLNEPCPIHIYTRVRLTDIALSY